MFRLLAPGQRAESENVYSYKYIVDSVKEKRLLDLSSYRLVHVKQWIFSCGLCGMLYWVSCPDAVVLIEHSVVIADGWTDSATAYCILAQ